MEVGNEEPPRIGGTGAEGINLISCVVWMEDTKIGTRPGMGRVVIATRDMDVLGAKLIREKPALVWSEHDWPEFLQKFQDSTPSRQRAVLDMFHPPLSSEAILPLRGQAQRLAARSSIGDVDLVHKLLAIVETNCHQYYGYADIAYAEVIGFQRPTGPTTSALFVYGSKVAHSCLPNTAYSSKTTDGCLEYMLIRPLKEGDSVTFSYLEKLFETPTHMRRAKLMASKSFLCKCERCIGPDFCRFLRCPLSGCGEYITCVDPEGDKALATWSCPSCGAIDAVKVGPQEDTEKYIQNALDELKIKAMFNLSNCPPSSCKAFVEMTSSRLTPLHHITLEAMQHLVIICASQQRSSSNWPE
jgi:hypothetical protein